MDIFRRAFRLSCALVNASHRHLSHRNRPFQSIGPSLESLPYDILLHIFGFLSVVDVVNLGQVSKLFRGLLDSPEVWKSQAANLMMMGRRISHSADFHLSERSLRDAITLIAAAQHNWSRNFPVHTSNPIITKLRSISLRLEPSSLLNDLNTLSARFLVIPTNQEELLIWDMKKKTVVSRYTMGDGFRLLDAKIDHASRAAYCLKGHAQLHSPFAKTYVTLFKAEFSARESPLSVKFEDVTTLIVPWDFSWTSGLLATFHILDVSRRMLCFAFSRPNTGTLCLHIILDWETGYTALADTRLIYQYGKSVIDIHLSNDGDCIVLHSEESGRKVERHYLLDELHAGAFIWGSEFSLDSAAIWNATTLSRVLRKFVPIRENSFDWEHEHHLVSHPMTTPRSIYNNTQCWHVYDGMPMYRSTAVLYLSISMAGERQWLISQHYSTTEGPCNPARSSLHLSNVAYIFRGRAVFPIVCVSFNHIAWIAELEFSEQRVKSFFQEKKRRVLWLVTLPGPGEWNVDDHLDLFSTAKQVEIPDRALNEANRIFIDEAEGTITLLTDANAAYTFYYGPRCLLT